MLRHPLLQACGVVHGFGLRGSPAPPALLRPRQVHGRRVVWAAECRGDAAPEADGILSREPGLPVGVVTADCVPVLLADRSGVVVAALHAGWRGLACGIVEAGVAALREHACAGSLVAVVGPHIGVCCYEVDDPVLEALAPCFGAGLAAALRPTRPGHALLDLGALTLDALERAGLDPPATARIASACTRCDSQRFHSFRRDGARAGRLVHFACAREA